MKFHLKVFFLFITLVAACSEDEKNIDPEDLIYNGDVRILNQDELEEFGKKGYKEINGSLVFGAPNQFNDIHDLSPLKSIITIKGDLIVSRTSLSNLIGLDISSIGGDFSIEGNNSLINFVGVNDLISLEGDLKINSNPKVTSLNGFSRLSIIKGNIGIENNDGLMSLVGFPKGISIGSLWIHYNVNLKNVEGIADVSFREYSFFTIGYNPGLNSLKGMPDINNKVVSLTIDGNDNLTHIDELSVLNNIKTIFISRNPKLENIDGLKNLLSVEDYLVIANNAKLTEIDGLNNLTIGPEHLGIYYSEGLQDLKGLENLKTVDSLHIKDNRNLKSLEGLSSIETCKDVFLENNLDLSDYCSLKLPLNNDDFNGTVRAINNLYNPTQEEIKNGQCSQ